MQTDDLMDMRNTTASSQGFCYTKLLQTQSLVIKAVPLDFLSLLQPVGVEDGLDSHFLCSKQAAYPSLFRWMVKMIRYDLFHSVTIHLGPGGRS
jgi:hypothetical protein